MQLQDGPLVFEVLHIHGRHSEDFTVDAVHDLCELVVYFPPGLGAQSDEQDQVDEERDHHENQVVNDHQNDEGRQDQKQSREVALTFVLAFFNHASHFDNFELNSTLLYGQVGC